MVVSSSSSNNHSRIDNMNGYHQHHHHQLSNNNHSKNEYPEKVAQIQQILDEPNVDLWKLRGLALTEGGLVNGVYYLFALFEITSVCITFAYTICFFIIHVDTLRRRAWPKLAGLHERLWEDVQQKQDSRRVSFAMTEASERSDSDSSCAPPHQQQQAAAAVIITTNSISSKPTGIPSSPLKLPRPPPKRRHSRQHSNNTSSADDCSVTSASSLRDKIMAKSIDFTQIELDVARCTWHLLTGTQRLVSLQMQHKRKNKKVARLIRRKQRRLANLINITLVQSYKRFSDTKGSDNTLRYFQGYHDVACIVLSTLSGSSPVRIRPSEQWFQNMGDMAVATGLDMPAAVLLQLSQSHLRDCMRANFLQLQTALRLTIFPLIAYFDAEVDQFLASCDMEPFFALSWVITWFSHEIRDTELVKRLFDFFLVSHPLMPIYVSVAMVCHPLNRLELLHRDCDFAEVHQALVALPKNSSMVGWKYRPGDGYVSDDEDEDDLSVGMMDSQSSVDTDFLLHEEALQSIRGVKGVATAEASTVSSAVSSMNEARVPFQEILDSAVGFMERLPPAQLLEVATKYYGKAEVDAMMEAAPGISFLQPPPSWTKAPTAKADWVLRQEDRTQRGLGPSKKDKKLLERLSEVQQVEYLDVEDEIDRKRIEADEVPNALAVVAAGFGSGDVAERRRRRKRKGMVFGAVAVAVLAVSVGFVLQGRRPKNAQPLVCSVALVAAAAGEACSVMGTSSRYSAC